MINLLANYLTNQKIPDLNSGLRVLKKNLISKYLHLCPDGFSFSITSTLILISEGFNVGYIPIEIKNRIGKSTVTIHTGLETFLLVLRLASLINPLKIYMPISFLFFILGIIGSIYYFFRGAGILGAPLIFILTSVFIFFFGLLADQISGLRKEKYK